MRKAQTVALLLPLLVFSSAALTQAGDAPPFSAAAGEGLARSAALNWAEDARLVYVENDEVVNADGSSPRWGYLFYSAGSRKARAYSIRGGKIRKAEDLGFAFAPPPLPEQWIDSGRALAAANERTREFRAAHGGAVRAMLLARGMLDPREPDAAAWAIVYESPDVAALWIVVDAGTGKVVRTWRG